MPDRHSLCTQSPRTRADAEPKVYAQIPETAELIRTIEEYLEDYNSVSTSPMRLVTFLDAAEHVARVARVLRTPLGHALLLGVGGSGRRSLARLAAHVEEYETREIEITKSYGAVDWKDDLRAALKSAGAAGKDVALIFSDTQVRPRLQFRLHLQCRLWAPRMGCCGVGFSGPVMVTGCCPYHCFSTELYGVERRVSSNVWFPCACDCRLTLTLRVVRS